MKNTIILTSILANSGKYGLSEFLIRKDAVTKVEFTLSTDEFVAWLEGQ